LKLGWQWIGIVIVAQSFTATPSHHAPAVVIGLLPALLVGVPIAKMHFGQQFGHAENL